VRVLVTGSSGHIGGAVVRRLQEEAEVIGLDLAPGPTTHRVGDIRDLELVRPLTESVEAVIHTASLHAPHVGVRSNDEFESINVEGTQNLITCSLASGVRWFVYTSTTSVYGCSSRPKKGEAVWVTEALEPYPEDIYDTTKLEAEARCRAAAGEGLSTICLRVSRCFPEAAHLVAFYRLYRGVDIRDVAEGHVLALKTDIVGYDVFNLSGPTPFAQEDCGRLWDDPWSVIENYYPGTETLFTQRRWPRPHRIDRVYVIDKARKALGYSPKHDLLAAMF
jgi:UDP-glucose 4-epimerase